MWVKVISEFVPKDITELSEIILRSSPILASKAIPTPPATVNAPSVAFVFAVVAEILTTPPEEIAIASVSDAEPIVPASSIISDPAVTPAVVTVKSPVDAPVNDPVPKRILSADSSYPMNTFALTQSIVLSHRSFR